MIKPSNTKMTMEQIGRLLMVVVLLLIAQTHMLNAQSTNTDDMANYHKVVEFEKPMTVTDYFKYLKQQDALGNTVDPNSTGFVDSKKFRFEEDEFKRFKALGRFYYDKEIRQHKQFGTSYDNLTILQERFEKRYNTYADYLDYIKTNTHRELWELDRSDGYLRMYVSDLGNLDAEESLKKLEMIREVTLNDGLIGVILCDGNSDTRLDINNSGKSRK